MILGKFSRHVVCSLAGLAATVDPDVDVDMVFDYTHNLQKMINDEIKGCAVHISQISFSKMNFSSTVIFYN